MIRKQIAWLWENMDAPYRRRHVIALCISVFTCLLLLVNPALSQRLIDDVIVPRIRSLCCLSWPSCWW